MNITQSHLGSQTTENRPFQGKKVFKSPPKKPQTQVANLLLLFLCFFSVLDCFPNISILIVQKVRAERQGIHYIILKWVFNSLAMVILLRQQRSFAVVFSQDLFFTL